MAAPDSQVIAQAITQLGKAMGADTIAAVKADVVALETGKANLAGGNQFAGDQEGVFLDRGGAAFNSALFASLNAMLTEIGVADATILLAPGDTKTLSANLTIPANITLSGQMGVIATNGHTLTVNGPISAGKWQLFDVSGGGSVVFGAGAVPDRMLPEWWGGRAGLTDSGAAIQAALTCAAAVGGGEVFLGDGIWRSTIPLVISGNYVSLVGRSAESARLIYTGGQFVDVISLASGVDEGVKIKQLRIDGGSFQAGTARYLIYAPEMHRDCEVVDCYLREAVGIIRIDAGFYARVSRNRLGPTVPNATLAGASLGEWQEVHGTDTAPILLASMNGCEVNANRIWRVGSEANSGNTPFATMILYGKASEFQANTIEDCRSYTSGSTFDLRAQHGLVLQDWIGRVDSLYVEGWHVLSNLFFMRRQSAVEFSAGQIYNVDCNTLWFTEASNNTYVRSTNGWRVRGNRLFQTSASAAGRDVVFENTSIVPGERVTDATVSGEPDNVYDTQGTSWPNGMIDGTPQQSATTLRNFPRSIAGYVVSADSDGNGAYIQVTGGAFLSQSGRYTQTARMQGQSDDAVVYRLRPQTASMYYRVWVGRAGQPYLTSSASPFTFPTGDWLAEFQTDGSTAITSLAANPRLSERGNYITGTSIVVASGSGAPSLAAPVGSTWHRSDGGAGTTLYVMESGGWVAK